jgi:hypothetical protein
MHDNYQVSEKEEDGVEKSTETFIEISVAAMRYFEFNTRILQNAPKDENKIRKVIMIE